MEDLISIIVPIYNVEKYLERCVASVRSQTYTNIEIILVDDGSPDQCGKICDDLATRDSRIKVIHKANGGLSDARNAGLEIAEGAFVGFIDSDDFLHPEMIRDLYCRINKHQADIAQCSFRSVTDDSITDPGDDNEKVLTNLEALRFLYTSYGVDYVLASNKLYRKSLFNRVRYPVSKIHEDEFTTYKLIYEARKVVVTDRKYYHYYQSPNSIIRSSFSPKRMHYADAMEERILFFRENGLEDLYSLAIRKYARWILIFIYMNRKALRNYPVITKELRTRYRKMELLIRRDPSVRKRLKMTLRFAPVVNPLPGFLVYQNLYRNNITGKVATWFGLDF
jgi:glycosyltransferase involved in cell wall biosynthesis